jgi:hypothetical protein
MPKFVGTWNAAALDPITIDTETKGGLQAVANSTERLNIEFLRRKVGMFVVQADTSVVYKMLSTGSVGVALSESDFEIQTIRSSQNITVANGTASLNTNVQGLSSLTSSNINVLNDIYVVGTASIGLLNTITQQSLQIGDKYIVILSGATDHVSLDQSGILWGSGSSGPTIGPAGENAYIRYDSTIDKLVIYPGLKVSGSLTASNGGFSGNGENITNILTTNITDFNSIVQSLISGTSNITVTNGTASLDANLQNLNSITSSYISGTQITASSISASEYIGLSADTINGFTNSVWNSVTGGLNISVFNGTASLSSSITSDVTRITGVETGSFSILSGSITTGSEAQFTILSGNTVTASSYEGIYSYDASSISVLRNDPANINKPYWSVITEDMVIKLITVTLDTSLSTNPLEMGIFLDSPNNLRGITQYERPLAARLTNNKTSEDVNAISYFSALPAPCTAIIPSTVSISGTSGQVSDSITYTLVVTSALSPSTTKSATATYYWGRYMYWGTHTTQPSSITANQAFIKGLAGNTLPYQNGEKQLVGNGIRSVSYTKTFNNVSTTAFAYVAYPNSLISSPTGIMINGDQANLISAGLVTDLGTFNVSLENNAGQQSISYRLLGLNSNFTANNTDKIFTMYVY